MLLQLHPAQMGLIQRTFFREEIRHSARDAKRRRRLLQDAVMAEGRERAQLLARRSHDDASLASALRATGNEHVDGDGDEENDAFLVNSKIRIGARGSGGVGASSGMLKLVPRRRARMILSALGINFARVEASGLSSKFNIKGGGGSFDVEGNYYPDNDNDDDEDDDHDDDDDDNGHGASGSGGQRSGDDDKFVDFDELLGIIAYIVHMYGPGLVAMTSSSGDGTAASGTLEDALSFMGDDLAVRARASFFGLAIDPSSGKAETKHCVVALRQLRLVRSDIELDKALRTSGTFPQYRSNWLGWPSFLRLAAELNFALAASDRLRSAAAAAASQPPPLYLMAPSSPPSAGRKGKVGKGASGGGRGGMAMATTSDIDVMRKELQGFVDDHHRFDKYMQQLNRTYRVSWVELRWKLC